MSRFRELVTLYSEQGPPHRIGRGQKDHRPVRDTNSLRGASFQCLILMDIQWLIQIPPSPKETYIGSYIMG